MFKRVAMITLAGAFFMTGCGTATTAVTSKTADTLAAESRGGLNQAVLLLGKEEFKKLDTSKDGFLSLDEWKAAGLDPKIFAKLDMTREGRLSLTDFIKHKDFSDFKAKVREVTGKVLAATDTDKNGLLSREEFKAALNSGKSEPANLGLSMAAFDLADRDLSADLSASELENLIGYSVAEAVLNKPAKPPTPPSNPPTPPANPGNPPANPGNPPAPPANPGTPPTK
jgi:Ca2+-binding EF-hand superfamily protein